MKVVVSTFLNIRIGKPSVNAPCIQYLAPGSEIEVEEKTCEGDLYKGINKWYRDAANNYYWSGGVNVFSQNNILTTTSGCFEKMQISTIWNKYKIKGANVKVLIVDTGIHPRFFNNKIDLPIENFVDNCNSDSPACDIENSDSLHHGNFCAALIASDFAGIGIAPDAVLNIAKVSNDGNYADANTIKLALKKYLNSNIDILNISIALPFVDNELKDIIDEHIQKGRIVNCAIGNDPRELNRPFPRYPACFDNTIAIGSINDDETLSGFSYNPQGTDLFCFGNNIQSIKNSQTPATDSGTSYSTAIFSGICALLVCALKQKKIAFDQNSFLKFVASNSKSVAYSTGKIVQPLNIIEKILNYEKDTL